MMPEKEGDSESKQEQLRQLKEMSLLSLSHTPSSELDEIIKIIKNFFGVYFGIKDEYTYSELLERAAASGLDSGTLDKLTQFVENLKYALYIKPETTDSDAEAIKQGIKELIERLVPDESKPPSKPVLPLVQLPLRPRFPLLKAFKGEKLKEQPGMQPSDIRRLSPEPGIKAEQPSVRKATNPQQDRKLVEIEAQVAALEKQITELKKPFIKLELESLKGDLRIYKADPSSMDPSLLEKRLNTLKGRLG